jgi:hypothetical protein
MLLLRHEIESNVHWPTVFEKAPVNAPEFIHFSSTSQPPRLTPRINVELDVVDGVCVGIEEVEDVGDVPVTAIKILTAADNVDVEAGTVGRTGKLSVVTLLVPVDISEAESEVIVLSTIDTVTA